MSALSIVVHVPPSVLVYPVTVVPARTRRTQRGAVPAGPAVCVLDPSCCVRRWKAVPLLPIPALPPAAPGAQRAANHHTRFRPGICPATLNRCGR
jgi:hypothetical protein